MWMVDCDDHEHVKDFKVSIGRELRPLIPRPIAAATTMMNCVFSATPSSCCCTNSPNIIGWSQPTSMQSLELFFRVLLTILEHDSFRIQQFNLRL